MKQLRSLIFTSYLIVSACAFGIFMTFCFWLPYRTHFALARSWARSVLFLLKELCGLTYTVEGLEHIPEGSHIVMSNHSSAWETIVLFTIFPPQVWVLKRELLWIPFIGSGLRLLQPIAINRAAGHRAVSQVVEQGQERLKKGLWVIIFPEGTRVVAGESRKYGVSGALLAIAAGRLIVPFSHNAGEFWARRGLLKKPGVVRVVIGAPLSPVGKDARTLTEETRAAIEGGCARIRERAR